MIATLTAGDADTWTDTLPGYSEADGWSVRYVIRRGGLRHELAATGSGTSWTVTVPSSTSAQFAAGRWEYSILATLAGERSTIETGTFVVYPDPSGDDEFASLREEIRLAEAALRKRLSGEMIESFSLRGQSVSLMAIDALKRFINSLKSELRMRVSRASGLNTTYTAVIKFA